MLPYAVDLVKIKGTIAIVGKFDYPAPVNLHDVLFKELMIKGLRVYREKEFIQAIRLLANNAESFSGLLTDMYDLSQINQAIDDFKAKKNLCKIMIKMNKEPDEY